MHESHDMCGKHLQEDIEKSAVWCKETKDLAIIRYAVQAMKTTLTKEKRLDVSDK